jgi:hypothetical protein
VRRVLFVSLVLVAAGASRAAAQTQPDLVRVEWLTGVLFHGDQAEATFALDATPFGGILIERSGGGLDVDPSLSYGLRLSYRLSNRLQVLGSWQHSEGRYRVTFPAESRDEGDFDLEALLLAGFDFTIGSRVESAMAIAKTDAYVAALRWEVPALRRHLFPFLSAGAGLYTESSGGDVFRMEFEGTVPAWAQIAERSGTNALAGQGISIFSIDSKDALVTLGGGFRASLGPRWGVELEVEDWVRLNPDLSHLDAASTPPPDVETFRLYQTTFQGGDGLIHNIGIHAAVNYAVWPFDAPR